jgi:hypothetical protein
MRSVKPRYNMFLEPRLAICLMMALLLSLLAACSTPTPAPTATPTDTATPTPAPTAAPTDTPTPTPNATPTDTPTPTPAPTATPTDTPTPTAMPTVAPTPKPTTPPTIPSECTPAGGATEPSVCVAGISVQINEGTPQPVAYEENITLNAGDILRLVNLRYCASREAGADRVSGEAYLFIDRVEDYGNGLFVRVGPRISAGCGPVGDFEGSWTLVAGQHRVLIALVHYFGDASEVDDRFFFNLDVGQ